MIDALLAAARDLEPVPSWADARPRIAEDHALLRQILADPAAPPVYGHTTRPGHQDDTAVDPVDVAAGRGMLRSHLLGSAPWMAPWTARVVGYAKVTSLAQGGTAIDPALFDALRQLVIDPGFAPSLPRHASYSSGDVIPGAHWADAVYTRLGRPPTPGEVMVLVNGCFVHVGAALAGLPRLRACVLLFAEAARANAAAVGAGPEVLTGVRWPLAEPLRSPASPAGPGSVQVPVSSRAAVPLLDAAWRAIERLGEDIADALSRPSGNPLFAGGVRRGLSQASFLAPAVTLSCGAAIEALLALSWASVQRLKHLLSGAVPWLPEDGGTPEDPLAWIQVPKLAMAWLERGRRTLGIRAFASGGSTSRGVEDFWTHGLETTHQLAEAIDLVERLASLELWCTLRAERLFRGRSTPFAPEVALDHPITGSAALRAAWIAAHGG